MKDLVNTCDMFKDVSKGDSNNCVVRAFAICMNCSYQEADEYAKEYLNREYSKGVNMKLLLSHLADNSKQLFNVLEDKNIKYKSQVRKVLKSNPTFNQFLKNFSLKNKTYFIVVKGHAFALKNGVIYGNEEDLTSIRKRVWGVFEF